MNIFNQCQYLIIRVLFCISLTLFSLQSLAINIDDIINGAISEPGEVDQYEFDGTQGQTLYFDSQTGYRFYLGWTLRSPTGVSVFSETYWSDRGPIVLPETGTYTLELKGVGDRILDYQFQIWNVPSPTNTYIDIAEIFFGEVKVPGQLDYFSFDGQANQIISFEHWKGFSTSFSWTLHSSGGAIISSGNTIISTGQIVLPQNDEYRLTIDGVGDNVGFYSMRLWDVPQDTIKTIAFDTPTNGAITALAEKHIYEFEVNADSQNPLQIMLDVIYNKSHDVYFDLQDPDGGRVFSNSLFDKSLTINKTGIYRLTAHAYAAVAGDYSFQLVLGADSIPVPAAADLVVTSINTPIRVIDTPAPIEISWTVTNNGSAATEVNEWLDRVEFRGENDFVQSIIVSNQLRRESSTVEDEVNHVGVLQPGESYTQSTTVMYQPEIDYQGYVKVVIITDVENAVFEDQGEDNISTSEHLTGIYSTPRVLGGAGGLDTDIQDGTVLPANVEFNLGGQASMRGRATNVVFIVDTTGSTNFESGLDANGDGSVDQEDDINKDGYVGNILDVELAAIMRVSEQLSANDNDVQVAVVPFGLANKTILDLGVDEHSQLFQKPNLHKASTTSEPDLTTALRSVRSLGGDGFHGGFQVANEALNGAPDADQTLVFLFTDGAEPPPTTELLNAFAAHGIRFFAYQVLGSTISSQLEFMLQTIDHHPASSAVGKIIENPDELTPVILNAFQLAGVNVNGVSVNSLDAAGNFFAPITLSEGNNVIHLEAFDSDGNSIRRDLNLIGVPPGSLFQQQDITGEAEISYKNTRYNRATGRLHVEARLINTSDFTMSSAVQVAMDTLPPAVQLDNPDGVNSQGKPFIIFDEEFGEFGLAKNLSSAPIAISLSNPGIDRFNINAYLQTAGNVAPQITSTPVVDINEGDSYSYEVMAYDANMDTLSVSLPVAPVGMSLDVTTGIISWSPSQSQLGVHSVELVVSDGRGGIARQNFQLTISSGLPDLAPFIVSTPAALAIRDISYQYSVAALDPEAKPLQYFLDNAPAGMSIDAASGLLSFVPLVNDVGIHAITVRVVDPAGNAGQQSWQLTVRDENLPPEFTSVPVTSVVAGTDYRYRALVTDDGGVIQFSLLTAPAGMTIDQNTGTLRMTPDDSQIGNYAVTVLVADDLGLVALQDFNLAITSDDIAPVVSVLLSDYLLDIGQSVNVEVLAVDNKAVTGISLEIDGVEHPLSNGQANFTPSNIGLYTISGLATDAMGNLGQTDVQLRVIDPNDKDVPGMQIVSPSTNTRVTYLTDIVGSVSGADLEFYQLDYARIDKIDVNNITPDDPDWINIATGTSEVSNAILGTFDPTVLSNNDYVIRLRSQDTNGNIGSVGIILGVSGDAKLGRFSLTYTDLAVPLAGLPIQIDRHYDTYSSGDAGDFGFGWDLKIAGGEINETVPVADNEESQGIFVANAYQSGTRVYLTNPDGDRIGFTFEPTVDGSKLGTIYHPAFTADPGIYDRLEVDDITLKQRADGTFGLFVLGFNYNPEDFRLIRSDGTVYHYNQFSGLQKVSDTNGNELTITDAGIFHSSGESIPFVRDDFNRIMQITDPNGELLLYDYDDAGNLVNVSYPNETSNGFSYLDSPAHYINEILDQSGLAVTRYEYDSSGRIAAVIDAQGNRTESNWDPKNFRGTQTDAKGNVTEYIYDNRGNVLTKTDPLGGVQTQTFDGNDNRISAIDENGNLTTYSYDDRGNTVMMTNALAETFHYAYDEYSRINTLSDPLNRSMLFTKDSSGNLIEFVTHGDQQVIIDYDNQGRAISFTDTRGNATWHEYDTNADSPNRVIDPSGGVSHLEYHWSGQVSRYVDPLGNEELFGYDNRGNRISYQDALGQETRYEYEDDQLIRIMNAKGHVTSNGYDQLGRLISITNPLSGQISIEYDANGNRTALTDPGGNTTRFIYDAKNQLKQRIDALGNITQHQYDAVGNRIQTVDRNGRIRNFSYDGLNRLITESWLDAAGSEINAIRTTYDIAGRRLSVADNFATITYTYDENDRIVQTDLSGTSVLPTVTLFYNYDSMGNRVQIADNAGVSVSSIYDGSNRLTSRIWQGVGAESVQIDINYNLAGKTDLVDRFSEVGGFSNPVLSSVFDYDARNQLTRLVHQDGAGMDMANYHYEYDALGRLITETHHSETLDYSYDALNQLLSADSSVYGVENFAYDANGNRTGSDYITGQANRLLNNGEFTFEYDAEGNMLRKEEVATGAYTEYQYDHRNRVIRITSIASNNAVDSESTYQYDAMNNRIVSNLDNVVTATVFDGQQTWADYDVIGMATNRYMYGDNMDQILARQSDTTANEWYLTDRLGTVRDIADSAGAINNHLDFSSYGELQDITNPNDDNRFTYTGRELNKITGQYYYRARFYDPTIGRFISEDPIGFESGDFNIYRYMANDPLSGTDPAGTMAFAEYRNLVCDIVMPIASQVETIGKCVGKMYEGINKAIETAQSGGDLTAQFLVCGYSGMLDSLGRQTAGFVLGKAEIPGGGPPNTEDPEDMLKYAACLKKSR